MGDGWETRRRRGPGHDWAIVRLGAPGLLTRVEIDTNHFKGNYPDSASLEGCLADADSLEALELAQLADDSSADEASRAPSALVLSRAAGRRRGIARSPQHLSGRRGQPSARSWNPGVVLTRPMRHPRGRCCAPAADPRGGSMA